MLPFRFRLYITPINSESLRFKVLHMCVLILGRESHQQQRAIPHLHPIIVVEVGLQICMNSARLARLSRLCGKKSGQNERDQAGKYSIH